MIETEQFEVGIKHQVEGTGLQINAALFDITRNNLIIDDPNSGNPNVFCDSRADVARRWRSASPTRRRARSSSTVTLPSLNAETSTGTTPTFTPEETFNLGLAWSIADSVRVITDARFVGDRAHRLPDVANPVLHGCSTPPLRWDVSDAIGLTVKVDNILDELYATAAYQEDQWMVGKPRTAGIAFDVSF